MLAIVTRVIGYKSWDKDAQVISVGATVTCSTTAGLERNSSLTVLRTASLRPKYQKVPRGCSPWLDDGRLLPVVSHGSSL